MKFLSLVVIFAVLAVIYTAPTKIKSTEAPHHEHSEAPHSEATHNSHTKKASHEETRASRPKRDAKPKKPTQAPHTEPNAIVIFSFEKKEWAIL